jgi:hypothetical protein
MGHLARGAERWRAMKSFNVMGYIAGAFLSLVLFVPSGIAAEISPTIIALENEAKKGDVNALLDLAKRYREGDGVPKDYDAAEQWYRRADFQLELKAAEDGYASAQANTGIKYELGDGVDVDQWKAINWYRKAADQGLAWAAYELAVHYQDGLIVPKDLEEAYFWVSLAVTSKDRKNSLDSSARDGLPESVRDVIAKQLSTERRAAVQRRVRKWKASPNKILADPLAPHDARTEEMKEGWNWVIKIREERDLKTMEEYAKDPGSLLRSR